MKKRLLLTAFIIAPFFVSAQAKVLVIGSYHMGNPGLDKFNMDADDVTVPKRQKEIEEFVEILAAFKPTKICLEVPLERNQQLNENYKAYCKSKFELKKNESHQLGFRLAKKLALNEVYAIDVQGEFNMDTVIKAAQKFQATEFLSLLEQIPAFIQAQNKKLHESTITEFYRYLNSESYVRQTHAPYIMMASVGKDQNYIGADVTADWYKRNLRIYRNIALIPHNKDDRFLIIYGAGHTKILQELIRDSSDFELVALSDIK